MTFCSKCLVVQVRLIYGRHKICSRLDSKLFQHRRMESFTSPDAGAGSARVLFLTFARHADDIEITTGRDIA